MEDYSVKSILQIVFSNKKDSYWNPSEKIPAIKKEIDLLKNNIKLFLDTSDYDLVSILAESKELCVESKALVEELKSCKEEIKNETMAEIEKSIESHDNIHEELQCVNYALNIVRDVVQCGKYVKEFDEGREKHSYTDAVEAVYNMLQYIEDPAEGFKNLDFYSNTKYTGQLILDNLLHEVFLEWDKMVTWSVKPGDHKSIITLNLTLSQSPSVLDVINALDKCNILTEKVAVFAQFILKDLLIPIMHNECIVHGETNELMIVTITYKENFKPKYNEVISNLRLLFHYLSNKLNINFCEEKSIMKMIGQEIRNKFKDALVKDCLIDTVPNNINDLQTYGMITSDIENFQQYLATINFCSDTFSILDYLNDIDILFANKASQYFLETARTIMLKDLSETMSIGVETIPDSVFNFTNQSSYENTEEALKIFNDTMPKSLFYFPRCMISKTAQELLDFIYVIMEQAVQCSDVVCKKLYNSTRLMFELYDAVVPYHQENFLQTIPQYVALFHNNCMYLAHNLQTFGDKWLILMEGRKLDYPISFVDLVQKLRDLGYKHLTMHMQQQRKQILDNIRSSDLNCIGVKDQLGENAEAAVRQCLRQLHLLKNVWVGVFPTNVFTRLIATLVNMFVEELIHRVCCAEDIPMETATQLIQIYTLLFQKAPQLFQNSADVNIHVKSWIKLQELIFVLGGSLKDIEKHWDDGTGSLSVHFKVEELRNLIKALFQNTQFRANLLSKIK